MEMLVGAAPTGDAATKSECSTILLPKVRLILVVKRWYAYGIATRVEEMNVSYPPVSSHEETII